MHSRFTKYLTVVGCALLLNACDKSGDAPAEPVRITVMTFNAENLFDNSDDPGKDDKAYLPIEAKQSEEHIAECNEIEVDAWRNECLNLDWSDAAIDRKLTLLANTTRQIEGGADVIAFQEVENIVSIRY